MAAQNILELEQFEANSFMGIDSSRPVVIQFPKNKKYIEFSGDQGVCKTSTLCGILYAMGATFNLDKKKLLNTTDGKIDVNLKFTYNDEQYHVIANSARTELKKLNENGKWKAEDSPVAMLKKIFGPVSLSPFSVREMKGKDQIKFFQEMFGSGEDASKKMKKLEEEIDIVFYERRDINKEANSLKGALELEPLFQDYEKSIERFAKPISAEKEEAKYKDLKKKKEAFDKYSDGLNTLKEAAKSLDEEITELEVKLIGLRKEKRETEERIEKGEKWVADNKSIVKEYDAAEKDWVNLSQILAAQEKWKDIVRREKKFNELTEQSITLTGILDTKRDQLLKLTKECLPKVDGLTIKVATGLDKGDSHEGVFHYDSPLHAMSESEYHTLWFEIFAAAGIGFLFQENMTSLGSNAVKVLNGLSKQGAIIFGTKMDRGTKEMAVSFKSKVE